MRHQKAWQRCPRGAATETEMKDLIRHERQINRQFGRCGVKFGILPAPQCGGSLSGKRPTGSPVPAKNFSESAQAQNK